MAYQRKEQEDGERKILLGLIGERIVAHYLRNMGHVVEESLNVFDTEKDMMVDGKPVEVKTQVPIIVEDSFGISPGQKTKIMNCHRVYFVSVPTKRTDDLAGGIFEMDPSAEDLKAHRWQRIDGKTMICFPRRQPAMKFVAQITDQGILDQLRKLSLSYL